MRLAVCIELYVYVCAVIDEEEDDDDDDDDDDWKKNSTSRSTYEYTERNDEYSISGLITTGPASGIASSIVCILASSPQAQVVFGRLISPEAAEESNRNLIWMSDCFLCS